MDNIKIANDYSFRLKAIEEHIENDALNSSDVLAITDVLDEVAEGSLKIQEKAKNVFSRAFAQNLKESTYKLFGRVQKLQNIRLEEDEHLLEDIYKLAYKIDKLAINFFKLTPYEIEDVLSKLDFQMDKIKKVRPYNEKLFKPLIIESQQKLNNLHFRYDFPIVEELDENNFTFAHRVFVHAKEIQRSDPKKAKELRKNLKKLKYLSKIALNYMYGNEKIANTFFEALDEKVINQIKQTLWQEKGKTIENLKNDKKWVMTSVIMKVVSDEINNSY